MIRRLCLIVLSGVVGALLLCSQAPMEAQTGSKTDKQIQQLKKTIAERDQTITQLNAKITSLQAGAKTTKTAAQLQKDLNAAKQSLKDKDDLIASLQGNDLSREVTSLRGRLRDLERLRKATFVHAAILKLKKEDDAQVQKIYDEAAKTLAKIDGVRGLWIGKRAENDTPELARKDYQLGLVVLLDDSDALQKFLDDPLRKQFTDKLADYWEKPAVYDFQRDMDADKKDDDKKKNAK
jgi:TolA-binding protein